MERIKWDTQAKCENKIPLVDFPTDQFVLLGFAWNSVVTGFQSSIWCLGIVNRIVGKVLVKCVGRIICLASAVSHFINIEIHQDCSVSRGLITNLVMGNR